MCLESVSRGKTMYLRKLQQKDAPLMLEWMHDSSVVKDLQTNFAKKTLEDCEAFIGNSQIDTGNLHLAIADENDEYMGTVSLKHIQGTSAEFGITIRSCAMGRGYSKWAMEEIFRKGAEKLSLEKIYWCVSPLNERALRFYDKNGYQRIDAPEKSIASMLVKEAIYTGEQIDNYIWYQMKIK